MSPVNLREKKDPEHAEALVLLTKAGQDVAHIFRVTNQGQGASDLHDQEGSEVLWVTSGIPPTDMSCRIVKGEVRNVRSGW